MMGFWFAIQVKPRHELATAAILRNKGYEDFVPLYRQQRLWSDRRKIVEFPLFQGYVFCKFNAESKAPIVTTPGVIRIVGNSKQPLPIDEKEILAIHSVSRAAVPAQPHPFVKVGFRVLISSGPMAGIEGIVADFKNRSVILSLNLLQKSISVDVGDCALTIISPRNHMPELDPYRALCDSD
jgi:transcription antitermination factor NusG